MFFMFLKYKNYNRKNYNIKFLIIVKDKKNSVGECCKIKIVKSIKRNSKYEDKIVAGDKL